MKTWHQNRRKSAEVHHRIAMVKKLGKDKAVDFFNPVSLSRFWLFLRERYSRSRTDPRTEFKAINNRIRNVLKAYRKGDITRTERDARLARI